MIRKLKHNFFSKHFDSLDNETLLDLLNETLPVHSAWGTTSKIEINGVPLFVKQLPLNNIEGKKENIQSTKNLFQIPLYYQYGVGSGGFSVWREIAAHEMASQWVLSNENLNFPLLYH